MTHGFRFSALVAPFALVSALAAAGSHVNREPQPTPPKLIVIIVVDQMRADYLERYSAGFTAGLRRLMREGAWFADAAYPYLNTVTCVGHSTIGTGMLPFHHGMIMNSWLDRGTGKTPYCTDDAAATEISYNGLQGATGDSAKQMRAPAIGEQIRARAHGRAVAMSIKPRSAIPLVGKSADAVVWFDDRGGWSTSSVFTPTPVPFLQQFIAANPVTADFGKVWTRTLPVSAYQFADDDPAERPGAGAGRTFPHPLGAAGGKPDASFFARWVGSPFSDDYLGRMGAAAVDALSLGKGEHTDLLAISFSALDAVGHVYGPRSHEVQDVLVRLDLTIGRLLDHLDRAVGAGNYVLGLSADHGVADIPEHVHGGRQGSKEIKDAVLSVLTPALGPGNHVVTVLYTDIYLSPTALERLRKDSTLASSTLDALRRLPGVAQAFLGDDLRGPEARASRDGLRRAAALSYYPGRSGDIIVVPKENWLLSSNVTTHGTQYPYDQRVPMILFGAGIRAGRYTQAATPADLMPSLAAVAHVPIAPTDGRVLAEALGK